MSICRYTTQVCDAYVIMIMFCYMLCCLMVPTDSAITQVTPWAGLVAAEEAKTGSMVARQPGTVARDSYVIVLVVLDLISPLDS